MKKFFLSRWLIIFFIGFSSYASAQQKTYCNPVNIDYGYTPIPNFTEWGKHRATADPAMVNYKGDFYLFSTNQWGYWWSSDMLNWHFISRKFLRPWNAGTYDELCAPAVGIIGDTMIVMGSTYTQTFTIWMSTNPKANEWKPLVDSFAIGGWDPAFFTDDDGKLYMYNGSSNRYPTQGVELNRKTMQPIGTRTPMYLLEDWRYGWQRFGEYMDNTFLDPFIEGSWMTKHNGKYYYQYGAPGTEMSGYADGVVVGDKPLFDGAETEPQSDPLSMKLGGFARGAGHGSTFRDDYGNYWHVSTIEISVKNNFERRIGIWPAGFDKDDVMWCNTAFGDYPHYLPASPNPSEGGASASNLSDSKSFTYADLNELYASSSKAPPPGMSGAFTGWMLLNYDKPVQVSSTLGDYNANNAVDENIKTYWSAASGNKGEWMQSDLGNVSTVNAIQINYADQDAAFLGKQMDIYHQYILYYSIDGKKWKVLIDKSNNKTDVPHDYIELTRPVQARFIKLENIHMPTGKFAISGLRVFGNGNGEKPDSVKTFMVLRTEKDKRSGWIRWSPVNNAYAYNIYWGTAPDKLYNCVMVMNNNTNEYWFKAMDKLKTYYFTIEAINESGVSTRKEILKVE
ncbi:MAG TPA: discoidin domain-containing protein [Chitinophagaceae bacterium]|nr:discoidin domain-containing protein [Chitinophagaceae bacterium]